MNTLEALYFPGTQIYSASQFPSLLFFQKIDLLQPVESNETDGDDADIFKTSGICQGHTPKPLGDDRDRFLHLINDIQSRKDDYAAQLSSLTVASLSEKKSSVDDSKSGIVASILGGHGLKPEKEDDEDIQLWQARLVLKIGEILDQEEEEVAMQMALLNDEEEGLFKELQGEMGEEEETLFAEMQQLSQNIARPSAATIKNRLAAWAKLAQAGEIPTRNIWLTHMSEAADILLEQYEEKMKLQPKLLIELPLPANIGWSRTECLEQIEQFKSENSTVIGQLAKGLAESADLSSLQATWETLLEQSFPAAETGRTSLAIYSLAGYDCAKLTTASSSNGGSLLGVVR